MPRIAYVGRLIPSVPETFIVREVAALRELGLAIKVFSVHNFDRDAIHPEIPGLQSETEVLSRPADPLFWFAHLFFAFAYPGRYWRCIWKYVLTGERRWPLRLRCLRFFIVAPYLAFLVRRYGLTHIHSHFANVPTAVAMMAAMLAKVPFSFTMHSRFESVIDSVLMEQKLEAAEFVVTISRFNLDNYLLPRYRAAKPSKIHVIRCGIDCENYSPVFHPQNSPPIILSIGRLSDTKGFPTLISACRILKEMGIEFRCRIIGDGPDKNALQEQIGSEGLSEQVTLLGKLPAESVKPYLARADLFTLPCCVSNSEAEKGNHDGIPYALIEAMAMGIPAVSTYIGGIPELISSGETGLLIQSEDPQSLAAAMTRIIQDKGLATKLSQAGRDYVKREFNVRTSADRLFELFMRGTLRNDVRNLRTSL